MGAFGAAGEGRRCGRGPSKTQSAFTDRQRRKNDVVGAFGTYLHSPMVKLTSRVAGRKFLEVFGGSVHSGRWSKGILYKAGPREQGHAGTQHWMEGTSAKSAPKHLTRREIDELATELNGAVNEEHLTPHRGLENMCSTRRHDVFSRILCGLAFEPHQDPMQAARAAMMPNTDPVDGDAAPCLAWTGPRHGPKQYARIHVRGIGNVYVHVLMAYFFLNRSQHTFPLQLNRGEKKSERIVVVGHNNPGCKCFSPHHISLKTQSQNAKDALAHGTAKMPNTVGENNGRHILTPEQVDDLRNNIDPLEVWKRGPECYGVGERQIAKIRARKAWNGDADAHVTYSAHDGQDAPGTTQESQVSKVRRKTLGKREMRSVRMLLCGLPGRRKKKGRRGPRQWHGSDGGTLAQVRRDGGDDMGEKHIRALTKPDGALFKWLQRHELRLRWGREESGIRSRNLHEMLLRCMRRRLRGMLLEEGVIEHNKRWRWGLEREEVWQCVQRGQQITARDMEHELASFANYLAQGQFDYVLLSEEERRQYDLRAEQRYVAAGGGTY